MSLVANGPAPYTTVLALTTVVDWFRDKGPTGPITTETVIRVGVPESLGRRTIQSLVLLDLIDEAGNPSEQFEAFHSIRGEEEYRTAFQEWVRATYADVLTYCDPAADPYDKIVESFRGYQPAGQRRAMASLFLGLWKHAGLLAPASGGQAKSSIASPRPSPARRDQGAPKTPVRVIRDSDRGHSGSPNTDGLPPGLVGLLHQIPVGGQSWTTARRAQFLQAFTGVLDFAVPVDDNPPSPVDEAEEGS